MRSILLGVLLLQAIGPQPDADFDPVVANPTYVENGPRVCIDEAHDNHHTADGRYKPLAQMLRSDGYEVVGSRQAFEAASLEACDILIVANARGRANAGNLAFAGWEIDAIVRWIEDGSSLLLIADHPPFGQAAAELSLAFDVRMVEGYLRDSVHNEPELPGPYFLRFDRAAGLLGDHPVLEGQSEVERITTVVTFGGQALEPLSGGTPLLALSRHAEIVDDPQTQAPEISPAQGVVHAIAIERGNGRVVIAGEAGLFSAQVIRGEAAAAMGLEEFRFGMTRDDTDNRQFVLNVMHWLSRSL